MCRCCPGCNRNNVDQNNIKKKGNQTCAVVCEGHWQVLSGSRFPPPSPSRLSKLSSSSEGVGPFLICVTQNH